MARPKSIAFSPMTQLAAALTDIATSCEVVNIAAFPDVAAGEVGYIVFSSDERFSSQVPADFETCTYTGKTGSTLTGLTRGVEGTAQAWSADPVTYCMSPFTADAFETTWDEIETHTGTTDEHVPINFFSAYPAPADVGTGEIAVVTEGMFGSNTYGSWVKLPDGTMLCWGTRTTSIAIDLAWGELFYSDDITVTWPQNFVAAPSPTYTGATTTFFMVLGRSAPTVSSHNISLVRAASSVSQSRTISWMAVGRWK